MVKVENARALLDTAIIRLGATAWDLVIVSLKEQLGTTGELAPDIMEKLQVLLAFGCLPISVNLFDMPRDGFPGEKVEMAKDTTPVSLMLHPIKMRAWMINLAMEIGTDTFKHA